MRRWLCDEAEESIVAEPVVVPVMGWIQTKCVAKICQKVKPKSRLTNVSSASNMGKRGFRQRIKGGEAENEERCLTEACCS